MSEAAVTMPVRTPRALPAILVGGLIAGGLDLIAAFISYGMRVPRVIAAGLLGREAIQGGGAGVYALGVVLQLFIATSAAAVYYGVSRKLGFLKDHPVVCGLFFGIAIYLVMNLVVLPLSALHSMGPYQWRSMVQGLLIHMIVIGLPISFSVSRFSK
jgi:hypothetical protein